MNFIVVMRHAVGVIHLKIYLTLDYHVIFMWIVFAPLLMVIVTIMTIVNL